jgi:hypothetical protein
VADGVRKSLSQEEHAIRALFDAMEKADERRGDLWSRLQDVRAKNAREKERLVVRVRLQENPTRSASCLVADLEILKSESHPGLGSHPNRIDAYVRCEVLFDTDLPPCERPGPCPHQVVVFVMKSDNGASAAAERAWDAARQMATGESGAG